jgi:hypothetical protein
MSDEGRRATSRLRIALPALDFSSSIDANFGALLSCRTVQQVWRLKSYLLSTKSASHTQWPRLLLIAPPLTSTSPIAPLTRLTSAPLSRIWRIRRAEVEVMYWAAGCRVLDRSDRALLLPCVLLRGVDVDSRGDRTVRSIIERACGGNRSGGWVIGTLHTPLERRNCASRNVTITGKDVLRGELC